jgi:hypothetical protein
LDKAVDFSALAALRPGAEWHALAEAIGSRWRPPAPHEQGQVKAIVNTFGFEARLDVSGHVAGLTFRRPFPDTVPIAGVRLGMSPLQAMAALPALTFSMRMQGYPASLYVAELSDHYRLVAEFHNETLYQVGFFVPDAVFPPKQPMVYPAAGAPGAPFRDPNFKLAVLSALLEADALDLATPKDMAAFVLGRPADLEREGYHLIRAAYDYLVRYPLTEADLDRVEAITLDGGEAIYRYCFYFWSGETGEFEIGSIEGIARCRNLRRLTCIAMADRIDANHLAGLSNLADVLLPAACLHPERLLDLPALEKLEFRRGTIDATLIARLRARGVAIRIDD